MSRERGFSDKDPTPARTSWSSTGDWTSLIHNHAWHFTFGSQIPRQREVARHCADTTLWWSSSRGPGRVGHFTQADETAKAPHNVLKKSCCEAPHVARHAGAAMSPAFSRPVIALGDRHAANLSVILLGTAAHGGTWLLH